MNSLLGNLYSKSANDCRRDLFLKSDHVGQSFVEVV